MGLVVTASLVTARTDNDRVVYLYRGDVVTKDLTAESVENLKSLGFVSEADEAPEKPVRKTATK